MTELIGAEWTLSPQKRGLDLLGMTALMPLFVPAGAGIAATIQSVDHMDPMFAQTRYGLRLEPFTLHKFRTMPPDTPETPSTGSGDSRRTALGSRLSALHLDEMPQAVNIYNGTMSMIGPRGLILEDVENTLDLLTATEQEEWLRSRWTAKPGVFGNFQLEQHLRGYKYESDEEYMRARAYTDIDYAAHASFRTDMGIVFRTAKAAFQTFSGQETNQNHLRGESGATMFRAAAEGFGVIVSDDEHEWWRAVLLSARCIDDIVDEQGMADVSIQFRDLLQGNAVAGMTQSEAEAFSIAYAKLSVEKQHEVLDTFLYLPGLARRKKAASSIKELVDINNAESEMFAGLLLLNANSTSRLKFNQWIKLFARTGYLADMVLDSRRDYSSGNLGIELSFMQKAKFGTRATLDSGRLLVAASPKSYRQLAHGVLKTLLS